MQQTRTATASSQDYCKGNNRGEYAEIWIKELGQDNFDKMSSDGRLREDTNARGEIMWYLYSESGGKKVKTTDTREVTHKDKEVDFNAAEWKKAIGGLAPQDRKWLRFATLEDLGAGSSGSKKGPSSEEGKESYEEALRRLQEARSNCFHNE